MGLALDEIDRLEANAEWGVREVGAKDAEIERLRAELTARPAPLAWTRKKPTVPGWYSWRIGRGYRRWIYEIESYDSKGLMVAFTINSPSPVPIFDHGEWSGPIPEPSEPTP